MKHYYFFIAFLALQMCEAVAPAKGNYIEVFKLPCEKEQHVSRTRYNYSRVAEQLTEGCATNLEKIEAIYNWLTANVAYDTSYSIHTADDCFDARKGVCQAYCELYYRIAEAAGLRVEIVRGITRDIFGRVSDAGHDWLFAYTRENYGILMDPTWDAGSVNGGVFIRETYHRGWFGVDPRWMILTHFPKDPSFQLLPDEMSEEEFRSLDYPFSLQYVYGFDAEEMYSRARTHSLSLPMCYSGGAGDFVILDAPLEAELSMGRDYTFRIRVMSDREFILATPRKWYSIMSGDWTDEGDGIFSIDYTPEVAGKVSLSVREETSGINASTLIVYSVGPVGTRITSDGNLVVTFKNNISEILSEGNE